MHPTTSRSGADGLAFPAAEYASRVAAARVAMAHQGLDLLIVSSAENLFYLTGFASLAWGRTVLILPVKSTPLWVMRQTELSNIRALASLLWCPDAIGVPDTAAFGDALTKAIQDVGGANARIGIEAAGTPASLFDFLTIAGRNIVYASGLVEKLRRIKSPGEIALMRQAGAIVAQSCIDGFESLRPGMLDSELAEIVSGSLIRHGSDRVAQLPNVASGPRSARAHITWGHLPIAPGELITVEPAACVENYHAPIYKIMSLGQPSPEALRMYAACQDAFNAGWAAIRPGMTSHDAATIYESAIRRAGYAELMVTRPAYSIGIAFPPGWGEDNVGSIRTGDEQPLEAGMCFHVCPCLYKDGIGCVVASMPVTLTETGFDSLSGGHTDLMVK